MIGLPERGVGSGQENAVPSSALDAAIAESGNVQADGRINVNMESRIARTLAHIVDNETECSDEEVGPYKEREDKESDKFNLRLSIVIQIVGSRGDVQPFIALGNTLQRHGHRVRLATHNVFEGFVQESGLEFFPIGGDPAELMAYMVKNPGLIPQMKSLRQREIHKKQVMVAEMLGGCWKSCIEDGPLTGEPFVADAIIANPPSFAHIHCAQALAIPVHLMFTMPWTSTREFPHPLANVFPGSMNPKTASWVSYGVVEWLTWQGLGDVINKWRATIDLEPIPRMVGPSLAEVLSIPFTYCWSAALVPKPLDWPAHIDVCGFFFRDPPQFTPPIDLEEFLQAGPPPIYIGFGSIVVDDPERLARIVLEGVKVANVRAIISKGWSNIVGEPNEKIYYIGDCPHEWLFRRVSAVVHHGGAGTTACGLLNARPTAIVPFFGDQPFWGNMVAKAGAGPKPIPYAALDPQNLAAAIETCLNPEARASAGEIALKMKSELGVDQAVESFHRNLPLSKMRCDVMPNEAAVWIYKSDKKVIKLSKPAMHVLMESWKLDGDCLKCCQIHPIHIENRRWDPITGVLSAATSTTTKLLSSTGDIFSNPYKEFNRNRTSNPNSRHKRSESQSSRGSSAVSSGSRDIHSSNSLETRSIESSMSRGESIISYGKHSLVTAGSMAGGTAKGVGRLTATWVKGLAADIPYAAAEGFRQAPRLYGEQPKDYDTIGGFKSGVVFGGKNFVDGMSDGLTGIIKQPINGAKQEGAIGALKGIAKGTLGVATRIPSAGIGLIAYPFHGISKSVEKAWRNKTRKEIFTARLRDGYSQAVKLQISEEQRVEVLQRFDRLVGCMVEEQASL